MGTFQVGYLRFKWGGLTFNVGYLSFRWEELTFLSAGIDLSVRVCEYNGKWVF